ncbi:hypothetical protein QBC40DRAFT_295100 [Triangularia verruculosa]|uniref:Uncharacterized protein n=1 Tax=Triangularia verruculosa TaxID=2587418 RepID=A0AAN6XJV9_9PEZI|nr:hypothetical protein QBC40DRAFT_295100 [Triangularia verruculosa]
MDPDWGYFDGISPHMWEPTGCPCKLQRWVRHQFRLFYEDLGRPYTQTRRSATFRIECEPSQFRDSQNWDYALTGVDNNVQAASPLDYMTQVWPDTGPALYSYLEWQLRGSALSSGEQRFQNGLVFPGHGEFRIVAEARRTLRDDPRYPDHMQLAGTWHLHALVVGEPEQIIELGSQLGWFCGAFLRCPADDAHMTVQPKLKHTESNVDSSALFDSSPDLEFYVGYIRNWCRSRRDTSVPQTCWKDLFLGKPHRCIVSGYPIRRPPDYMFNNKLAKYVVSGLETTWRIIMRIRQDDTAVEKPENLSTTPIIIRGEGFFLISKVLKKGLVYWHLQLRYGSDLVETSLCDLPPPETSIGFDFEEMENYRHFIGGECGEKRLFQSDYSREVYEGVFCSG